MSDRATHLRQRAARLRTLASEIERLPVMQLERHAAEDTWRGSRAQLCLATLAANQQQLHHAADEARWSAWRLDQRADELDAFDRLHHGLAG